jgi:PPK2 family polyphosphate:nucleotide phosphotransferase
MKIKPIIADSKLKLSKVKPDSLCGFKGDEAAARERAAKLNAELVKLQNVLYAEHKQRVLIVLQAMDTGGKDGAVRKVFSGVNPQGVKIVSFKAPTAPELDHDYLWRVHPHVPGKGDIVVFNRSHYEDVLITRVHGWIDKKQCEKRYRHINEFERLLADEGTTVLKFFLHISKDEQKKRLQERLDDPSKHWKFNVGDLAERKLWDKYQDAYEVALRETSSKAAPWYVVPADNKWLRDVYLLEVIVEALESLKMKYPPDPEGLDKIVIED